MHLFIILFRYFCIRTKVPNLQRPGVFSKESEAPYRIVHIVFIMYNFHSTLVEETLALKYEIIIEYEVLRTRAIKNMNIFNFLQKRSVLIV